MYRIAFIGAGSFGFTRNLVRDILTFERLTDSTIVLMDIDEERLSFSEQAVKKIIKEGSYPAKVETTLDRKKALNGANAVVCTILSGDVDVWRYDIEIPKEYGININVGDTRGPAGVFRALRTIPVMLDICKDMEKICPDAILLNYTNPMAMLCRAMQRRSSIKLTGLCHSVQGTAEMLSNWIGAPMAEIDYVCAGINHQAWYLRFEWNRKDAYPLIREAMGKPEIYNAEIVRNEMFLHLDYYVTESSGHNSEYNWWFRTSDELIEKYCGKGTNWNPGEYAFVLKEYLRRKDEWKDDITSWLNQDKPLDLKRGNEYAANIINAYTGGEPYEFNGNVPNTGLIPNLQENACVEVPVLANRRGFNPIYVGSLPPQLAALNNINIASEEMAVEAALTGDPRLVFHSIAYDPLTAAVSTLSDIKEMVNAMFNKSKDYLPQFKSRK